MGRHQMLKSAGTVRSGCRVQEMAIPKGAEGHCQGQASSDLSYDSSMPLQMGKLDSDPASGAARTNACAPTKGAAPPATSYNPRTETFYEDFFNLPAVKAATPPAEAPEQADSAKLPGRKPPGSRAAPKHGHVLDMLSRSGKKASEGGAASGSASNARAPLISRAGKRGSGCAAGSASSASRIIPQEESREAESHPHGQPQPAFRQARVFDLLSRPSSSNGGNAQQGGTEAICAMPLPDKSAAGSPAVPDMDPEAPGTLHQNATVQDGDFASHQQPAPHNRPYSAPDSASGYDDDIPAELDTDAQMEDKEADAEDKGQGQAQQQGDSNRLSQIDAATWARLPADVQASILAGDVVNLETMLGTPAPPGTIAQVCLPPFISRLRRYLLS